MFRNIFKVSLAVVLVLLAFKLVNTVRAQSTATYYVAGSGSDSNPGTQSSPWKTIQKAVSTVPSGSVVNVAAGTYAGSITIGKPLTLEGAGDSTIIQGDANSVGITINAQATISNLSLTGSGNGGIFISPSADNTLISHLKIYHLGQYLVRNVAQHVTVEYVDGSGVSQSFPGASVNLDADCFLVLGGDATYRYNNCHDIDSTVGTPHSDCFQSWTPAVKGTNTYDHNVCNMPIVPANSGQGTACYTLNDGATATFYFTNNVCNTDLGIGQFNNGSPNVHWHILNNTFMGNPGEGYDFANLLMFLPFSNIDEFKNNLVTATKMNLSGSAAFSGSNNWFYQAGKTVALPKAYTGSGDTLNVDPGLQSNFTLASGSPACSANVGAFPCSGGGAPLPTTGTQTATPKPAATPTTAPIATPVVIPGDANGDGHVNEADYTIWLNNFGKTVANGASQGDFNNNLKVDGVDFVIWLNNFGK